MFKAKKRGKDSMQYFDASILKDFLHNVAIETKLKEAVFAQNFTMNFQPQYFTENGKLRGMEALIRWRDNDGRMISPAVFIPIAEKNGTIVPDFFPMEKGLSHTNDLIFEYFSYSV